MCLQEMQLLRSTVFLSAIDFDVLSSHVPIRANAYVTHVQVLPCQVFQCVNSFKIYFVMFHSI